jgi:Ca2+-binding EF-hand superfamily protein
VTYSEFKELFSFEENERDKKHLKKDFKRIEKKHSGKVKFKHLIGTHPFSSNASIDFYLTSSSQFGDSMKAIDTGRILDGLDSEKDGFNEKILKLVCINQIAAKMEQELATLSQIKTQLVLNL